MQITDIMSTITHRGAGKTYRTDTIIEAQKLPYTPLRIPKEFLIKPIMSGCTITNQLIYDWIGDNIGAFGSHQNVYVFMYNIYTITYSALYAEFVHNANINTCTVGGNSIALTTHTDVHQYVFDICAKIIAEIVDFTYGTTDVEQNTKIVQSIMDVHKSVVADSPINIDAYQYVLPLHDWSVYMYIDYHTGLARYITCDMTDVVQSYGYKLDLGSATTH